LLLEGGDVDARPREWSRLFMDMKTVQEFCANCNKTMEMPVVQQDENNPDLVWVECPECHEIKPLDKASSPLRKNKSQKTKSGQGKTGDQQTAPTREYPGADTYKVGDIIHHTRWDDVGKVMDKKTSTGGHSMIIVEFEKSGKKKLLI
jgi:hypothetical protein